MSDIKDIEDSLQEIINYKTKNKPLKTTIFEKTIRTSTVLHNAHVIALKKEKEKLYNKAKIVINNLTLPQAIYFLNKIRRDKDDYS